MISLRRGHWIAALLILFFLTTLGVGLRHNRTMGFPFFPIKPVFTKQSLARVMSAVPIYSQLPSEVSLPAEGSEGGTRRAIIQYAFDEHLQEEMENTLKLYRPDYGAFVALDAETGRVLAMVSYCDREQLKNNLVLRASFPSASVFKVVTASAAIAEKQFTADTPITFQGRNHTLYKSAILHGLEKPNRWTRTMTLREAFARSVNTVFGKIGAYTVGARVLRLYADRFQFNHVIQSDVPVEAGRAPITDDPWSLAETASGFTRDNTMSPLQGALIAATIVNNGKMMEPFFIQSLHALDGSLLYSATPVLAQQAVDLTTAQQMQSLMRETVDHGTSRGSFRGFFKGRYSNLDVGGKTGSLTGTDPAGKYDWFIGYAQGSGRKIAVAALTIHKQYWKVKSSYLARIGIERFFKTLPDTPENPVNVAHR